MRGFAARLRVICVREKSHLLIGGGYVISTFWHSSALMSAVYGVAALAGTHIVHRASRESKPTLRHTPRHLARD